MKKWYQSKTIWFNIITVAVGAIGELSKTIPMNAQTAQIFGGVLSVGNIILRFLTSQPIAPTKTS